MRLPRGLRLRDWNRRPTCPGLQPGWFLLGDREMWYGWRICTLRISLIRSAYVGVCHNCSIAYDRRGFRVNYDIDPVGTRGD